MAAPLRGGAFDLIVSNPPYIPADEIGALDREVREHDPLLALDGGADGLEAYRALAPHIARLLAPGDARFFVEFGLGQARDVIAIFAAAGLETKATHKDMAGIERAISGALADAARSDESEPRTDSRTSR